MLQTAAGPVEADDRTGLFLEAAQALLDEGGLDGLTIRAVLARTGLARRAFYERFGGKDDLVLAVFERSLGDAARYFAVQGALLDSPVERLRLIVAGIVLGRARLAQDGSWENSRTSSALSREHLRLAEARPADLQRAVSPLVAVIASELAAGMTLGSVRQADPDRLAKLVYNLVSTTVHAEMLAEETTGPDRQRRERMADEIWQFCERAIKA